MSVNRELMERYWAAAEANDLDAMHHLRDEALVVDFPQTGERLSGRDVVRDFEEGRGAGGSFELTLLTGEGDVWVAEGLMRSGEGMTYVVSISELRASRDARSRDAWSRLRRVKGTSGVRPACRYTEGDPAATSAVAL